MDTKGHLSHSLEESTDYRFLYLDFHLESYTPYFGKISLFKTFFHDFLIKTESKAILNFGICPWASFEKPD